MLLPRRSRQGEAVSGIRRPINARALQSYFSVMAPIKRAEKERLENVGLTREQMEQEEKQHEEELGLEREGLEIQKAIQKENAKIALQGLDLQGRIAKEAEKQGKIGTWLSGAGLAIEGLQALQNRNRSPWDWTTKYRDYGYGDGTGGGDGGLYGFSVPGGAGIGYSISW